MTTPYKTVKITSAEQASVLPVGTLVTDMEGGRVISAFDPESFGVVAGVGDTVLVPIEAAEPETLADGGDEA